MNEKPVHVLLVEDNPGDSRLFREHLAEAGATGFTAEIVQTLAGAVERCSRPGVDVVFLDLGLPDSVGFDTLKTLQACAPELPVVVLTGLADEKIAVQAVRAGAQDYLPKGEIGGAVILRSLRYAIARKRAEVYRGMGLTILDILNRNGTLEDAVGHALEEVKNKTGVDAVGFRMQDGEDFPYYAQIGFPEDFLLAENTLTSRGADGRLCRDKNGKVCLECTCGLVISGKTDPAHPLFTRGGSFWTNDSLPLPDLPSGLDPRLQARNQCLRQGYAAMALIPVRDKDKIIGLLHLAGLRKGGFTLETVELLEFVASHIGTALTRKHTEEKLQKIDKLQSVGTLAGGIAHDFNNILLGLFGNISLAKEELPKGHPACALLDEAEKVMKRAVRLTKQLLTFAKGGAPVKEVLSLGELIEEVARFDLSGSNVGLDYQPAEALWAVQADKGQLQQVLSNLVINARQAMPQGGRLHVAVENAELSGSAHPGLCRGKYVKVTVRDEGCGIDPKVLGNIFDPYFSTKTTGHGLGLATVWAILNKHDGHIGVESEMGKGTTFTFYLPAAAPLTAAPAEPAAESPPPSPPRPAKILVLDDETMIGALVTKMLAPCGYAVTAALDGPAALALYRQALEAGEPFDAVIMDLTIPGGPGGKEIIQELLALDPLVRALVSSGYADDPVMANPADYGFKGTVAKPYTGAALREALAQILKGRN